MRFLSASSLCVLLAWTWCRAAVAADPTVNSARPAKRLNVLLIVVDDLNTDLGCYGATAVHSPNIDRLAKRGVRFERAYCQYALCAPSRSSFLSGLRPQSTGIFDLQTLLRPKLPEVVFLPQLFREHGYFTAGMGKVFHNERQSDREKSWDFYQDKMGADEQEAAAVKERYSHPEGQRPFTPWTQLAGPEEHTRDGATSRRIAQHVAQCARDGQPFFVAAGFHKPHLPWTAPTRYFDLYRNRQIVEPHDPQVRGIPAIALMTELSGNPPPPRAEAIATYYACISFMDAQVGALLDALDREQLWDETVVALLSDHGYHLGDHQGLWAKLTVFDRGCRVPLVIAAPGHAQGASSPRTVELIDVYPTLAELCGLTPPSKLEGHSLVPLLARPDAPWDRPAHSLVHHQGLIGRTVCNERWRYTEWDDGKSHELYDHHTDPGEYHNLADEPHQAATLAEMKRLLLP
jgi:iduronate 2-sulfatase